VVDIEVHEERLDEVVKTVEEERLCESEKDVLTELGKEKLAVLVKSTVAVVVDVNLTTTVAGVLEVIIVVSLDNGLA
jgi:phage host-nuclease inhibitor protein Gam